MWGSVQLSHSCSHENSTGEGAEDSSQKGNPVEVRKFSLDDVKGSVCTTQKVTIPPFGTVNVCTNTSVKGHCMQVHVHTELMPGPQLPAAVVPIATYGELHPGSSRVPIHLCNLSTGAVEIPSKAMVGQVASANQVPPVVHPTKTTEETSNKASKDGSWRLWTSKASQNGLSQSRNRPGSSCSNGSTCLHTVTWIWAKLL